MPAIAIRFDEQHHDDIIYPDAIPFVLVHLAALGALWSGISWTAAILFGVLFFGRMFAITGGFHRYFSHRSYQTSRAFQFVLAFAGQMSLQKGILWWSAQHRHHHKHSDTIEDIHSPGMHGFFFSHVGWIFSGKRSRADFDLIPDLTKYPELRLLERFAHLPGVALAVACLAIGGWPGLFVGFFLSTSLLYHTTFAINSLAHTFGRQRYLTGDDSRNSWWLALLTMGEGWHNNHHYYQAATRQGWRWWEIDITYYILRLLAVLGIVWDLKEPPAEVVRGERRLARSTIDRVATRVAAGIPVDSIAAAVREAWDQAPGLDELRAGGARARARVAEMLDEAHRPELPSMEELRQRVEQMALRTPSLDDVVVRAREIVRDAVAARLLEAPAPA
jgi:stearoyl-CoA desaturase (delta-9 desaturase)